MKRITKGLLATGLLTATLIFNLSFLPIYGQSADEAAETREHLEQTFTQAFREDFTKVLFNAQDYLRAQPKVTPPKQAAIVMDLDETLIDNRAYFLRHGHYDPTLWEDWVFEENAPALPESLAFYYWLKEQNYAVFFITGRKQSWKTATMNNLKRYGINFFDGIFFKPDDYDKNSASNFKEAARKDIEAMGFDIQLILGDQSSDLPNDEQHEAWDDGKGFKLPNPIYNIP